MPEKTTPPPPLPAAHAAPGPGVSGLAIWSLVLAILFFTGGWLFTAIPAVVCGHLALSKIGKSGGSLGGRGIALVGLVVGYIGLVLGILGIPLIVGMFKADREQARRLETERHELTSSDGTIALTVPRMWVNMPGLNANAVLQAGSKTDETYVIVLSQKKRDVAELPLAKHHQLGRDSMLGKMEGASATAPVNLTIDGKPAMQDELTGTDNRATVVFLHTTIDDGDRLEQILAWTLKSRWEQRNAVLREVTSSFHRVK